MGVAAMPVTPHELLHRLRIQARRMQWFYVERINDIEMRAWSD